MKLDKPSRRFAPLALPSEVSKRDFDHLSRFTDGCVRLLAQALLLTNPAVDFADHLCGEVLLARTFEDGPRLIEAERRKDRVVGSSQPFDQSRDFFARARLVVRVLLVEEAVGALSHGGQVTAAQHSVGAA